MTKKRGQYTHSPHYYVNNQLNSLYCCQFCYIISQTLPLSGTLRHLSLHKDNLRRSLGELQKYPLCIISKIHASFTSSTHASPKRASLAPTSGDRAETPSEGLVVRFSCLVGFNLGSGSYTTSTGEKMDSLACMN